MTDASLIPISTGRHGLNPGTGVAYGTLFTLQGIILSGLNYFHLLPPAPPTLHYS